MASSAGLDGVHPKLGHDRIAWLAIQLAGDGIRSNAIYPGPTESPMQQRWESNPKGRTAVASAVPLGRVGRVTDLADACLFLLSDQAAWIVSSMPFRKTR